MTKVVITKVNNRLVSAVLENGKVVELECIEENKKNRVGNIFIGKIENISKNINAAFVDFGKGCKGYLALEKMDTWVFTHQARKNQVTIGDEVVVQIKKSAVKTKLPVLDGNFQLQGRYSVLLHGDSSISVSKKIKDSQWKIEISQKLQQLLPKGCGMIVRTNAYENEEKLVEEFKSLLETYIELCEKSVYKKSFSLLYQMPPAYIEQLLSMKEATVVTDEKEVYESLSSAENVSFYEDSLLPLAKLHSLETVIERALKPYVWLKSGGFLVIEPTEALTVIDVNTGKTVIKNKTKEETIFKTNLEAAKEIAYQIRLRNLSGILIIDFIDMEDKEHQKELLAYLKECVSKDSVKTDVIDMTKLQLVEMTRRRIKKPLYEVMRIE